MERRTRSHSGTRARRLLPGAVLAALLAFPAAAQDAPPPAPPSPRPPAAKVNPVFLPRSMPHDRVFKDTGSTAFGPETEKAVAAALGWLARHQRAEGNWDADNFFERCQGTFCDGPGGPVFDPALAGLALLAFLAHGDSPRDAGQAGDVLRRGLAWLVACQDSEGCFGTRTTGHFIYNHAIAGMALAEAHAISGTGEYAVAAQKAATFSIECQNPYLGWRYGVKPQDNDSSVTGWMTHQLKTAEWAGLRVTPSAYAGALDWFDRVTDPGVGRTGYTARGNGPARPQELMDVYPMDQSESLTAISVTARFLCGAGSTPEVSKGLGLFRAVLPRAQPRGYVDYYFWYWGTLASFQAGGEAWKAWQDPLVKTLLASQRLEATECRRGSWEPLDPWGPDGGRIYSTAILALCLEAPYRYTRLSATPAGRTTLNLETDPPGARVTLDGVLLGTTPLRDVAMPPGISTLRLIHPAAADTSVPVDLAPLEKNDAGNVGLPSGAAVDLSAIPPSVSVFHEGRRISGASSVRPGSVRLLLVQPRCRSRVEVREAKKGEKILLEGTPLEKVNDWSKAAVRNQAAPTAWTGPLPAADKGIHVYEGRFYCEKDGAEMVVVPGFVPEGMDAATLAPFLVDRHEITVDQYMKFCAATKRKAPRQPAGTGDDHPVVGVSCADATAYAAWAGKRLPTADEWFRAAYGNVPAAIQLERPYYPWGQFDSVEARLLPAAGKAAPRPEKVGSFPAGASPCGVLDAIGNAFEWCAPTIDGGKPVAFHERGGSWLDDHWSRDSALDEVHPDAGFRCAKDL